MKGEPLTPVLAFDCPGVQYTPPMRKAIAAAAARMGRKPDELLHRAHVHIYGEGDPVVASADAPLAGSGVMKPDATTFKFRIAANAA